MSFDWNQYIVLAEELNSGIPTDAKMRSAVSRAYYGAFIQCRNQSPFINDKSGDIHRKVIHHFKEAGTKQEYTIGNNLDDIRKKRNDADYNGFYKCTPQSTNLNIQSAKSIIKILKNLIKP